MELIAARVLIVQVRLLRILPIAVNDVVETREAVDVTGAILAGLLAIQPHVKHSRHRSKISQSNFLVR
jgi:hypothetical protein